MPYLQCLLTSKSVPRNSRAWELKKRIEEALRIVQEHVEGEILRQKKYQQTELGTI
jgi:(2Fe-2S) ferredoxin